MFLWRQLGLNRYSRVNIRNQIRLYGTYAVFLIKFEMGGKPCFRGFPISAIGEIESLIN